MCNSARKWKPFHTVILLTNPSHIISSTQSLSLSLKPTSKIEVNPDISEVKQLRLYAEKLMQREHANPPFPEDSESFRTSYTLPYPYTVSTGRSLRDSSPEFDIETVENAAVQILFTLAEISKFATANPKQQFTGYVNVLITSLHIVSLQSRHMLLSSQCSNCAQPLFSNTLGTIKCRHCNQSMRLTRINPRILGPVIDETGQIETGKLVFSDRAWEQLLGRTVDQFMKDEVQSLRYMEQRLLFVRVSLGFGWCGGGEGRLCIWGVRM